MKVFVCMQGDGWVYRKPLWKTHWRKKAERRSDEHKNHKPENNDVSHYRLYTVYENIEQTFYTLYKWYIIFHHYNRAFVDMHMYTVCMWSVIRWFINRVRFTSSVHLTNGQDVQNQIHTVFQLIFHPNIIYIYIL